MEGHCHLALCIVLAGTGFLSFRETVGLTSEEVNMKDNWQLEEKIVYNDDSASAFRDSSCDMNCQAEKLKTGIDGLNGVVAGLDQDNFLQFATGLLTIASSFLSVLGPVGSAMGFLGGILGLGGNPNKQIMERLSQISNTLKIMERKIDNIYNVVDEAVQMNEFTKVRQKIYVLRDTYGDYVTVNDEQTLSKFNKTCNEGQLDEIFAFFMVRLTGQGSFISMFRTWCNMEKLMSAVKTMIGTFYETSFLFVSCQAVIHGNSTHTISEAAVLRNAEKRQQQLNDIYSALNTTLESLAHGNTLSSCVDADAHSSLTKTIGLFKESNNENATDFHASKIDVTAFRNALSEKYVWRKWSTIFYSAKLNGYGTHTFGCTANIKQTGLCKYYLRVFSQNVLIVSPSYVKAWDANKLLSCVSSVVSSHAIDCQKVYSKIETCTKEQGRPTAVSGCFHADNWKNHDSNSKVSFDTNKFFVHHCSSTAPDRHCVQLLAV